MIHVMCLRSPANYECSRSWRRWWRWCNYTNLPIWN